MSIGTSESTRPVKPPRVKRIRKPIANSIGVSKLSAPFHIVANQLNTLTPVGTAISVVAYMKNSCPVTGMPTVYMWCAQRMNDRMAIAEVSYTMEAEPKRGLHEKAGITCETTPKADSAR